MRRKLFLGAASTAALLTTGRAAAAGGRTLRFQTHAAFFSRETGTVPGVDPQVFVRDPTVTSAGVGPQKIEHSAGVRPLRLDDVTLPLFSAGGAHLGFTSTKWLTAGGTASLRPPSARGQQIDLHCERLVAFGVYSVFKNIFGPAGVTFVPLDGAGTRNTFKVGAEGAVVFSVRTPDPLDERNAILLVYHSDGRDHGKERGIIGWNAHHHLIAPLARG